MEKKVGPEIGDEKTSLMEQDLRSLTKTIRSRIAKITAGLFVKYREVLVRESAEYVAPAVWGQLDGGELDEVQKKIHQTLTPEIKRVVNALKSPDTTPAQEFGIVFLVRELMIWKLCLAIELSRDVPIVESVEDFDKSGYDLEHMEPEGNA